MAQSLVLEERAPPALMLANISSLILLLTAAWTGCATSPGLSIMLLRRAIQCFAGAGFAVRLRASIYQPLRNPRKNWPDPVLDDLLRLVISVIAIIDIHSPSPKSGAGARQAAR